MNKIYIVFKSPNATIVNIYEDEKDAEFVASKYEDYYVQPYQIVSKKDVISSLLRLGKIDETI